MSAKDDGIKVCYILSAGDFSPEDFSSSYTLEKRKDIKSRAIFSAFLI